jgi:hypothetical protein
MNPALLIAASQQRHLQQHQQYPNHQQILIQNAIQYQRSMLLQQQFRIQQQHHQQQQLQLQEREQISSTTSKDKIDNDDEIESIGNEYEFSDQKQQQQHEQISDCDSEELDEDDDENGCMKNVDLIVRNNKENKFKLKLENSTGSTPEQSSTSGCTSSSYYCNETSFNQLKSNLTYSSPISSASSSTSSSSVSSSCNSSNSNTPQTQISIKQEKSFMDSGNSTKTIVNVRKLNEKKINFACISSLID